MVGRHFKIKRVDNLGIVLLAGSQDWLNRVLDTLPIHILIIGALLGGADNNVLPYPLELRVYADLKSHQIEAECDLKNEATSCNLLAAKL